MATNKIPTVNWHRGQSAAYKVKEDKRPGIALDKLDEHLKEIRFQGAKIVKNYKYDGPLKNKQARKDTVASMAGLPSTHIDRRRRSKSAIALNGKNGIQIKRIKQIKSDSNLRKSDKSVSKNQPSKTSK